MFSRIIRNKTFIQNRLLSSIVAHEQSREVNYVKTSKITSKKQHEKELQEFLNNDNDIKSIKQYIPTILLNRTYDPSAIYLIDKKVATLIACAIRKKIPIKNTKNIQILEANPGLGLLTDELIKKGFQNISLFESKVHFFNYLIDKYENRNMYINCDDFFSIWKLAYQDRFDNGTRVADLLENFKLTSWTSGSSGMKIIGSIPNTTFIKHMIYSVILQIGLVMYGRPEMFLVMQPSVYLQLTAQPDDGFMSYRSSSVLFQLLFNSEIVEKLPRESYLPWQYLRSKKRTTSPFKGIDPDYLYLVHISGKKVLPVPNNELQPLWYFVRHHMLSRTNRVIPQLERWIPGSGSKFIAASTRSSDKRDKFKNIGIFTKFGELTPEQILELFKQFASMPEYQESPFLASMETSLLKLESNEESANAVEITDANHNEQELFEENNENIPEKSR